MAKIIIESSDNPTIEIHSEEVDIGIQGIQGIPGPAGPSTIPAAVGVPALINAYLRITLQVDNSSILEVLRDETWTKIVTWR